MRLLITLSVHLDKMDVSAIGLKSFCFSSYFLGISTIFDNFHDFFSLIRSVKSLVIHNLLFGKILTVFVQTVHVHCHMN